MEASECIHINQDDNDVEPSLNGKSLERILCHQYHQGLSPTNACVCVQVCGVKRLGCNVKRPGGVTPEVKNLR